MQRRGRAHAARAMLACLAIVTSAGLCVLWLVSSWCGFYMRQGLSTVHLEDGAVSYWHAPSYSPTYARENSWKFYPVHHNNLNSYVPLFTRAPGRFDVIARVPFWMPLLITLPVAVVIWRTVQRDRLRMRSGLCGECGYDRTGLVGPCPECGRD